MAVFIVVVPLAMLGSVGGTLLLHTGRSGFGRVLLLSVFLPFTVVVARFGGVRSVVYSRGRRRWRGARGSSLGWHCESPLSRLSNAFVREPGRIPRYRRLIPTAGLSITYVTRQRTLPAEGETDGRAQ